MVPAGAIGSGELRVSRMRVSVAGGDGLRARQRIEAHLAGLDASALGLPARALLLVKRVAARIDISRRATGTLGATGTLLDDLKGYARRARRPWLEPDVSQADAVLFTDDAELVACLVRDWLRGLVTAHWWWRSVLDRASAEEWLGHHVLPRGEALVPALSLLAPRGDVVPWIARLRDADARVAAVAIARAFAFPITPPLSSVVGPARPGTKDDVTTPLSEDRHASPPRAEAAARLIGTVPEVHSAPLGRMQRHLLACAGVALRAPAWGRSQAFADALVALDRAGVDRAAPVAPTASDIVAISLAHDRIVDGVARDAGLARANADAAPRDDPALRDAPDPGPAPPGAMLRAQHDTPHQRAAPTDGGAAREPEGRVAAPRTTRDALPAAMLETTADAETRPAAFVDTAEGVAEESRLPVVQPPGDGWSTLQAPRIDTEYGGTFYLLNAWLAMGLYADFSSPRGTNLAVSPWDLLALVGRAWFGGPFVLDPIWKTLAGLAVRAPDDEPGGDVDLPEGWLDQHLQVLTARLREALGADVASDIRALVCRCRAQIEITVSSLDVHLVLSELPLDVRIAGLDRDPGWMPAAGRSVAFHFE